MPFLQWLPIALRVRAGSPSEESKARYDPCLPPSTLAHISSRTVTGLSWEPQGLCAGSTWLVLHCLASGLCPVILTSVLKVQVSRPSTPPPASPTTLFSQVHRTFDVPQVVLAYFVYPLSSPLECTLRKDRDWICPIPCCVPSA